MMAIIIVMMSWFRSVTWEARVMSTRGHNSPPTSAAGNGDDDDNDNDKVIL